MALVSLLPMALLGWRLIELGQLGVKTAIMELNLNVADKVASDFNAYVRSADGALRTTISAMKNMDWENKQTLLASLLDTRPEIRELSVLSKDGAELLKVISPYHEGDQKFKNYGWASGFKDVRKGERRRISIDPETRMAALYYPFNKDMVMRTELDLPSFISSLELKKVGTEGFPIVLDSDGKPIAWPVDVSSRTVSAAAGWSVAGIAAKALAAGSSEFSDGDGRPMLGAYSPIRELGGAVLVTQPLEGAYRSAMFMRRQAIYVMLLFLLLASAAGWFMSRTLSKPIIKLTRAAEFVADGDFTHKAEIDTSDELRDLADTFNKMVTQLKTYSDMQVDRIIREQKNTEAILFSTEDGIIMTDIHGKVQVANRKARSVLGVPQDGEVQGKFIEDLVNAEQVLEPVLDVFKTEKENYFREIEIVQESSDRFFKCFATPIVAPGHAEPIGRLIGFYDITLDKQLAKMKDEFLHSITHDLRNPMGAIKGFVEFMLKEIPGPVNEGQRKMLVSIDRAAFRLLGMINNILDSAKMEAGKMDISLAPVNLREVATRVNSLMESLGQRKKIKFEVEGPGELAINADGGLIERMFTNLIGNAIKFTPENGTITIGFEDNGAHITAWVRDTGDGIPPEYLGKVFEKFEQVKGQKAGGTGLGLTICKFVSSAHLGRIWAESPPGEGAKFIFSIPKNLVKDAEGKVTVKGGS